MSCVSRHCEWLFFRPLERPSPRSKPVFQLGEVDRALHDTEAKNGQLGVVHLQLEADDTRLFTGYERDREGGDGAEEAASPGTSEEQGGGLVGRGVGGEQRGFAQEIDDVGFAREQRETASAREEKEP